MLLPISTSQAMRFNLTGALAANQNVLLPQSVAGMWVVTNSTSGAFTITFGSNNGSNVAAGTTVSCPQGYSILVYCDGTNVKKADDGLITSVLPVTSGGTGLSSLNLNNVILGNGTSAVQFVAPGASGNILTSNGTSWVSTSATSSSGRLVSAPSIFTTGSGTYTVSASTNSIYVEVIGAGGGSGGGTSSPGNYVGAGGGGGGGAYAAKYFTVTPSTGYSYTVGSGGTAGAFNNASPGGTGGTGGSSTFVVSAVTVTAGGGSGGTGANTGVPGNCGAGGSATNGDLNESGNIGYQSGPGAGIFASAGAGGVGSQGSGNIGKNGLIRIWEYT